VLQIQRLNDFVQVRNLDELTAGLRKVSTGYQIIVFAFLTNLIVVSGEGQHAPHERLALIEDTFNTLIPVLT